MKQNFFITGGTGSFAEGLVIRWAKAGHEVIIGSRTQEKADAAAAEIGAKAKEQGVGGNIVGLENGEAAKATEVVVVCLPPEYTKATLEGISDSFTDQVVISPVVPMQFGKVVSYSPPEAGSAAVEIQNTLPDTVKVVSAYHGSLFLFHSPNIPLILKCEIEFEMGDFLFFHNML